MLGVSESCRLGEHRLHYSPAITPIYQPKIDYQNHYIDNPQIHRCDDNNEGDYDGGSEGILSSPSSPGPPRPSTTVGDNFSDDDSFILYYCEENKSREQGTSSIDSSTIAYETDKDPLAEVTAIRKPFDLSAFAKALYDTRLSVIQCGGGEELLLNEEDERAYANLLALRREDIGHERTVEAIIHDQAELKLHQISQETKENTAVTAIGSAAVVHCKPSQSSSNLSQSSRFKELFDIDLTKTQQNMAEDVVDVDEAVAGHGITKNPRRAKATRSLGFFGSLRQVTNRTRSQSTSSIRGLMRSISTGRNGSSGSSGSSGSRNSNRSSRNSINASNTTSPQTLISPAGLATLKHPEITNDMHRRREQQQGQQQQSEESMGNNRGIRLLSQLVGRVKRTTSPHRPTKRINMGGGSKDNERSRLVRRTIIYVQPDAENFFKTLGHLDETPVEPRETHVNSANDRQPLEGVEMREMSDGSVTWGIIKRQGRRKSFFDPQESKCEIEEDDDEETEEQIEGRVLALMGLRPDFLKDFQPNAPCHQPPPSSAPAPPAPPPIPARSPFRPQHEEATHIHSISNRRDDSTTDIYYAPNATLPSLLQMISEQDEKLKESPSVEEQLDEVIQSFSSCGYP